MRSVLRFALSVLFFTGNFLLLQTEIFADSRFVINPVNEFYANGNDSLDDWQAIQSAFDRAYDISQSRANTRVKIYLPRGIYYTSKTLQIRSNVEFVGDRFATEIRPLSTPDPGHPEIDIYPSPILLARGIHGGLYRNFRLNGMARESNAGTGIVGIHLAGTSNVTVRRIETYDIGRTELTSGGTHLLISASEPEAKAEAQFGPPGVSSRGNRIERCRFLDPHYTTSFLVRLMTKWKVSKADQDFVTPVADTVIRKNLFRGGFWNALEVAGPGTVRNSSRYNIFVNSLQTAFEADKGASRNLFQANRVFHARPNSVMATPQTTSKSSMLMVIRDQGIPSLPGVYPPRFARDNSYIRNVIRGAHGVYNKTGGFLLNRSYGAFIFKNRIVSIDIPGKSARPAAFFFWHEVEGQVISKNRIPKNIDKFRRLPD